MDDISIADTSLKEEEASWTPNMTSFAAYNYPIKSLPSSSSSSSSLRTSSDIYANNNDTTSMINYKDPLGLESISLDLLIDSSLPSHTLVLNKYNTFRLHALLITNSYQSQSNGLNIQDIEATMLYIQAIDAVGFFNSGKISGASQLHKHIH